MSNNGEERIDELRRIAAAHSGILRPEDVIKAAKAESNPLHSAFTWDNTRAAHLWRLEQARHLIRVSVEYIEQAPKKPMRVFVSLTTERKDGVKGYRDTIQVLTTKQLRQQLLEDARADMVLFRNKYQHLSELADVMRVMTKAERRIARKKH